jgi:transmembrane sensor
MTNIVEFEARQAALREAREWLIRLDDDEPLADTESEALREWMRSNPSHRKELTRLANFWDSANVLTEFAVPLARGPVATHAVSRVGPVRLAMSALLFAVILSSWWFFRSEGTANGAYGTAIGQQRTLVLPDGSSVQLNTDSQVQVVYGNQARIIRLLRGEALFSVAHNSQRPFDVYAGDAVVRAVGTAFSVRLEDSQFDVTVTKGLVDVINVSSGSPITHGSTLDSERPPRKQRRLNAGQTATFDGDASPIDVRQLADAELKRRMAWHEGYLVFAGEPLSEVVKQVNRYSPVTLEIADPALASLRIGGRFRVGDLAAVRDALRANFDIQSQQLDDRHVRLEAASGRRAAPL